LQGYFLVHVGNTVNKLVYLQDGETSLVLRAGYKPVTFGYSPAKLQQGYLQPEDGSAVWPKHVAEL